MQSIGNIVIASPRAGYLGLPLRHLRIALGLLIFAQIGWAAPAWAAAGDLDPTFGVGGKVTTDIFGNFDNAQSVAVQADGKIVAAGYAHNPGPGVDSNFALARYNADGTLDTDPVTGFGEQLVVGGNRTGMVTTDFFGRDDVAHSVAVQADGKIVAAGLAVAVVPNIGRDSSLFALARYNADGSLDLNFGTGGKVTTNFVFPDGFLGRAAALSVALQTDGKIVAAGVVVDGRGSLFFALARYNADGTLDTDPVTGFGEQLVVGGNRTGKVTTSNGHAALSVAVQTDGKIVAAGGNPDPDFQSSFALARYNADGSLDSSFGTGGMVTTIFHVVTNQDVARSVAVQTDGKIVAAGSTRIPVQGVPTQFALARYNADGSLDATFGPDGTGKVTTSFFGFSDAARSVAVQADGKIVAAGRALVIDPDPNIGSSSLFALARYNANGGLDSSFGTGGKVTTSFFGVATHSAAQSVAVQADGKIVAAGQAFDAVGGEFFALARYDDDGGASIQVAIDIKPGHRRNKVNPSCAGTIEVAILSSATFDAVDEVEPASLTFGRTGDEESLFRCGSKGKKVNRDRLRDLVCRFNGAAAGFQVGDTEGILKGETVTGTPIEGRDAVVIEAKTKQKGKGRDNDDCDD